ncbi:MAG: autotransporter domain-containing protein [Bradyrhizobium sp.]|uniref:autotransporter outer membrane beta-barrel domain-containing protein n=1 Tax=Bradyrhizobium sp. TaxID=376 RepID=UPI00273195C6|nr:autotransporter domain-containing protein [Bradyrhizobium sp.]MDP1866474.1 autotransporter domain-containing protein [Bradyrhizobium sp.]
MAGTTIRSINTGHRPRPGLRHFLAILLATSALGVVSAHAVDGTWLGNSGTPTEWFDPANWTSNPDLPDGTATFTNNGASATVDVNGLVNIGAASFTGTAPAYTININDLFLFNGTGVTNNSAATQTFNVSSSLAFQNSSSASAGAGPVSYNNGSIISFLDTSTAGSATIANSGTVEFNNTSTAATATITNNAVINFQDSSSAGSAGITNNASGTIAFNTTSTAGTSTLDNSGTLQFLNSSTAGGANVTNALGATLDFFNSSSAGSATINNAVGGVVTFHDTSTAGTASFINNGSLIFANSNTITASGLISGGGTLSIAGPGTLILSNTNLYTGATTVNGGALIVDGSTALSSLTTVNAGGTLGGSGIVGNAAIIGGTLAPGSAGGSAFGPLTVQGDLSFTAASTYMIQISPANAGRTNLSGVATLGGATVNATFQPGSYVDRQYVIVNATGGVGGTFNPAVTSNTANIQSTLSYDANNAFLNIELIFATPPGGSLNANQQNVANALTGFVNRTGGIPIEFAALDAAGLTIASGELGTGIIQSAIRADDLFLNLLLDPAVAGRAGGFATGGGASPFADEEALAYGAKRRATPGERAAYAMAKKAPGLLAAQSANRWSVWGAAYGGSATTGGNTSVGSQDTTSRVYGVVGGADYKVTPNTLLGFALAGGGTNYSLANAMGRGSSDLFQAGTFGRLSFGPAYISAALAYGWHDVTTNRTVALAGVDQLQGRFRAETFSARFEGGYRFATPFIGITPYAAAQAISFNLPGYAEQSLVGNGQFALNYASQTTTATRTELGLRGDKSIAMRDAVLTLRGRAAWAHDYNPDRAVTAEFQSLPGANFVVNGARGNPDAALVSAGAEMKWLSGFSLMATFEGEFSGNVTSYAGKGVARYTW